MVLVIDLANTVKSIAGMERVTRRFVQVNPNADAAEHKSRRRGRVARSQDARCLQRQRVPTARNDSARSAIISILVTNFRSGSWRAKRTAKRTRKERGVRDAHKASVACGARTRTSSTKRRNQGR